MLVRFFSMAGKLVVVTLLAAQAPLALGYDLKVNGFGSLVGGGLLTGDPEANPGTVEGPSFIADYGNGFVYTKKHFLLNPESRAGLQVDLKITDQLSATVQGIGRTGNKSGSLEWAYLSYEIGTNFTIQAGRKRIPIFYYSDFQDIGYAYIWVRPPGELYGWDMNNYNGASFRYHGNMGDLSVSSSFFGGSGSQEHDGYFKPYYPFNVKGQWNNILGVDAELNYEWLTTRLVYIQSENRYDAGDGWADYGFQVDYTTKQHIVGLAINMDFDSFFTLTETNYITHLGEKTAFTTPSYSVGAGYRLGKWTPFINYSDYTDSTTTPDTYAPQRTDNWSFTLRYDVASGQDLKLQYNKFTDMSPLLFVGNSQLITLSYDVSLSSK